ncbi:MAG: TonB-dependent receptor [Bacteroides sp.]|nr:TonB-dependent receptor [Bacteroides sp.]
MSGVLISIAVSAQNIQVRGQVKDTTSETIIGANVIVAGTTNGTITDFDGNFQIDAPRNSTLVISCIGYQPIEVTATDGSPLNIVMKEDSELLDEVVVIGYGQVRKADATGSVLTVKPDEFNKGSQITAEDALVGKIAGVNVVPGSGAPGEGGTIRIRMGASLSASNDPLIVIDGFPVSGSSISSINPNDIESFTVLKDASATAIYGSRASNGVIIITTKKGNSDGKLKPRVNYSSNFTLSTVYDYMDVLSADEYRKVFKEHATSPDFPLGNADTDWQKEIYRNAFGQEHNLSVTGATRHLPYRVSVGYTNQDGIIKSNNYERTSLGLGVSPKFFDNHLSIDANIKGSIENNQTVSSGVIGSAVSFDPTRPIYEDYPDNVGLGYYTWMVNGNPISIAPVNPVATINLTDRNKKTKRSIGNMALNYKVHGLEDLVLSVNMGYDWSVANTHNVTPDKAPSMYTGNQTNGTGEDYREKNENRSTLLDMYANYSKELNKHNMSIMGGYGWQRFWYRNNDSTKDLEGNELKSGKHDEAELYLLSFFGRANYSYDHRYMLTATLRADASSRFASGERWGYFPSVAGAWRISEEAFLQDSPSLSDLKFRLSYGQTGQQSIGSYYQHLATYEASYNEYRYKFGNTWYTTYRPNGYDSKIKWETTTTYNIGLDFGFLGNRISGTLDFYTRKTKDLLNYIYVPAGNNFTNVIDTNIGNMKGKGVEIALTAIPIKTKDFEWSVSGNFTWNTSKITKLNTIDTEDNYVKTGNAGGTGKYLQVHKVGETPYTFFLLKQAYDEDGNPLDGKYIDHDGNITESEEDSNKYVTGKSSQVPYFYGFSTKLTWKNWDLGINAHGSFGNYVFNYVDAGYSFASLYSSQGTSGNILRSTLKNAFKDQRLYTDHFLENARFLRIDNIRLGYTFNKLWNNSSNLTVSFAVQNVVTFTPYSGIDPEIYNGIDNNTYQRPRVYMFGLNLNF